MSFLIPEALAQDGAPAGTGFEPLFMLAIFGLIFYFLIWRPQSKRTKEHKALLADLAKGDEIISSGGVAGKITKVTENFVVVEIAEGVEIKLQIASVANVLPKGTLKAI